VDFISFTFNDIYFFLLLIIAVTAPALATAIRAKAIFATMTPICGKDGLLSLLFSESTKSGSSSSAGGSGMTVGSVTVIVSLAV